MELDSTTIGEKIFKYYKTSMNKDIKPLVLKIPQCAQKNEDLKWVMNTEGKIPKKNG
jgi:hypothetical protein